MGGCSDRVFAGLNATSCSWSDEHEVDDVVVASEVGEEESGVLFSDVWQGTSD